MAKVLFIQEEASEKFGTMILAAVLKKAGHEVNLFIQNLEKDTIFAYLEGHQVDFLAFSITTIERKWAIELATQIKKKYSLWTVFGGADPTYVPDELIKEKSVDYLCRGEGETAFIELIKRINKGQAIKGLTNVWGREKGKIIKNELGNLIADLDKLPVPDREIYYQYSLLRNLSTKKILCSRGCPYNCSFCNNHAYLKLFAGKGKYVRYRNPEKIIEEILDIKKLYGYKRLYFADETFTSNHEWLYRFLDLYRKKIKAPFSCLARANELDEKTIKVLKQSGCFYVAFGVETGCERIRNEILKRNMSDEVLLKVALLMHKYHLPFLSHHMYILPTESISDAFKTVELDIKMQPDSVWDTVFQPFMNTEVYDYCEKNKLLPKIIITDSMFGESHIKNPDKKIIGNLRKLVWLSVKLPFLWPLVKKIIYWPPNPVFNLILKISEVYSIKGRWRLGYWEMARLAWQTGNKLG